MRKLFILLLALLAIAAIAYFCLYKTRVPAIESDIAARTQAALAKNGLASIGVEVDGRDITLTGTTASPQLKQTAEKLAQVYGYNFINNNIQVGSENSHLAETAARQYSLIIALDEMGNLSLDGILDEASHKELYQAAIKRYGETRVKDRILELDVPVAAGMPDAAVFMLEKMSGLQSGELIVENQQIDMKGVSASKLLLSQVRQQLEEKVPQGYALNLDLTTPESAADRLAIKPVTARQRQRCQQQLNRILKRGKVRFNSSSAVIKRSSYKTLNKLAKIAKQCPGMKIKIHGHTDSTGRNSANKKLSIKRAQAVADYLVKKGIPESYLIPIGHGSSRPVASNKTSKGRARNRRIELTVERVKQ